MDRKPQRGRMSTPTIQPFDIMYTRLNALTLFYYVAEPDEYYTSSSSSRFTHDWIGRSTITIDPNTKFWAIFN